jgi:DNA-binding response OmpR family regulator
VCLDAARDHGLGSAVAPERPLLGAMVGALAEALSTRRICVRLRSAELVLAGAVAHVGGVRIQLTGREAAVLAVLARRAGRVVSKPTLLREVWGDAQADPHALEVTVGRLRRQLGPAGADLTTVVRRGYLLTSA